jgi:hypothetical protein
VPLTEPACCPLLLPGGASSRGPKLPAALLPPPPSLVELLHLLLNPPTVPGLLACSCASLSMMPLR